MRLCKFRETSVEQKSLDLNKSDLIKPNLIQTNHNTHKRFHNTEVCICLSSSCLSNSVLPKPLVFCFCVINIYDLAQELSTI